MCTGSVWDVLCTQQVHVCSFPCVRDTRMINPCMHTLLVCLTDTFLTGFLILLLSWDFYLQHYLSQHLSFVRCGKQVFAMRAPYVYMLENGYAKPSADVLRALCWNDSNMYGQIRSTSLTPKSSLFHRCVSLLLHPFHWVCQPPEGV